MANAPQSNMSGCKFTQTLVNQTPIYDNAKRKRMVRDRHLKIDRPRKQKPKWV